MALGYPAQTPLQYNPFLKTSFGFGTNALQNLPNNPFPNATDYVRVVITVDDATHWDDSGHIQTAEVGTAVSVYSSETFTWEVEGERNDVETILAELVFYPPAYQPLTDWQPTALKENIDDGSYTDEEPVDTAAVPDTYMEIFVYNSTNQVTAYDIYVEAVNPIYDNPRPYFSSSVQVIDVASSAFVFQGDLLPLNLVVENTDNEEILEVKSEFIRTTDGTQYTGTAYGLFTDYQDIYIGGKKGIPQNTTDKRFNFIGKKEECNLFLEKLNFTTYTSSMQSPAESSFFLRTSVSDGQVGSYVDTLIWHSDTYPRWSGDLTSQSFTEDTQADWDFGVITFQNLDSMGECDTFSAIITLGNGGENGVADLYTTTQVDSQPLQNGVLTITDSDPSVILTALRNLVYIPKQDFSSDFTFSLNFHFESSVYGTSYQSTDVDTFVVYATPQDELSNPHITYNFIEDFPKVMQSGAYPQIIHPHNETFQVDFIADQIGIGNILTINQNVTFEKLSEGHTRFTGSKSDVNNALFTMVYSPNPDINGLVSFTIELNRLTGNLDYHTTTYGSITLTGEPRDEYTINNPGPLDWEEDVSLSFNTGLRIIDDATSVLYLPAYGTEYTVNVRLRDPYGNQFTDGLLTSPNKNELTSYNNYGGEFTMTGSREAINLCLQNFKFVPNVDYESRLGYVDDTYVNADYVEYKNFYIDFYIERNYDSVVLMNYSYKIFFNPPTIHEETSYTPIIIGDNVLVEDTVLYFNTGLQILDKATENSDYSLYDTTYTLETRVLTEILYVEDDYIEDISDSYSDEYSYVKNIFPATDVLLQSGRADLVDSYSGTGTVSDPFVMSATKSNMNTCLSYMAFSIAEVDREPTNTWWILEYKLYRTYDNKTYYDYDIKTIIGALQPQDEVTYTQQNYIDWYVNDPVVFSSGLTIVDSSTDNELYPNYYNTTWTVEIKSHQQQNLYVDNGYVDSNYVEDTAPVNDIRLSTTRVDLLDSISGTGRGYDYVTMTGSREAINACLHTLKMIPDIDWTTNESFYFTFKITRNADNIIYYNHNVSRTFNPTQLQELFVSNVPDRNLGTPDNPKRAIRWTPYDVGTLSYPTNINLFEINDRITEHPEYPEYYNTQYLLKFRLKQYMSGPLRYNRSDGYGSYGHNFAELYNTSAYQSNTQGGIGSIDDPFYFYGSRQQILDLLNNLQFKVNTSPFDERLNWSNGFMYLDLYLERVYDSVVLSNWTEVALQDISNVDYSSAYTIEDVLDKLLTQQEWLIPPTIFTMPETFDLIKSSDMFDYYNFWQNKINNYDFVLEVQGGDMWAHPDRTEPFNIVTLTGSISEMNDQVREYIYYSPTNTNQVTFSLFVRSPSPNGIIEWAGNNYDFERTVITVTEDNSVSTPIQV